jgi:hypothetical protein
MCEPLVRWADADRAAAENLAPLRLQLFRGAKFDLQQISRNRNGLPAMCIDRRSGWENPFLDQVFTPTLAVEMFRLWLEGGMPPDEATLCSGRRRRQAAWLIDRRQRLLLAMPALRGKNLACWCGPRQPCHGDVLLEIANAPPKIKRGAKEKSGAGVEFLFSA